MSSSSGSRALDSGLAVDYIHSEATPISARAHNVRCCLVLHAPPCEFLSAYTRVTPTPRATLGLISKYLFPRFLKEKAHVRIIAF